MPKAGLNTSTRRPLQAARSASPSSSTRSPRPRITTGAAARNSGQSEPNPAASVASGRFRQRDFRPASVQRPQRRHRIAAAAAQARAHRDALFQGETHSARSNPWPWQTPGPPSARGSSHPPGPPDHRRPACRDCVEPRPSRVADNVVAPRQRRDHRHQIVIPVRPPAGDGQEQVQLGGRKDGDGVHKRAVQSPFTPNLRLRASLFSSSFTPAAAARCYIRCTILIRQLRA
jgi:hypothetical protein